MPRRVLFVAGLLLCPAPAAARQAHDDHHAHRHEAPGAACTAVAPPWAGLSDSAQAQVRAVEASVAAFRTPAEARRAGFRPALGLIPTMGVHWVNAARMQRGFDRGEPDHLRFATVAGKEQLVGVAYAFYSTPDGALPDAFDGDLDHWHDHPELAPWGQTLTMLHVWFVPSPDGPFAGHNPWLPFMAVGLDAPDACSLQDDAHSVRVRKLALALGETVQPFRMADIVGRLTQPSAAAALDRRREEVRTLVPRLREAAAAGDSAAWNALADEGARHWDAFREAYLASIPLPLVRQRLQAFLDEMTTPNAHGKH
jgi:hypothetical protein